MGWDLEEPAKRVADRLWGDSSQRLPNEILKLRDDIAVIIVDIDGIDYGLAMQLAPNQRQRPTPN